ncbi:MAG: 2-phospho-L-lactate transferase [Candidatus Hydrothermarchaeales archaeon]
MITVLSGGTGTPKLIQGLAKIVAEEDLAVVVNTAEDHWLTHGYFSPDVDTVVYTLAGIIDDTTWHGIKRDTYHTHETLKRVGSTVYLKIGDRDRALHIWRGEKMKAGASLSQVTREHCRVLGVKAEVIPMSDDMVETVIKTEEGEMDLHEFWVKKRGEPEVEGVRFEGLQKAKACAEAVDAIEEAQRVVIGPSNPITSVYPIISLRGIKEALKRNRKKVIGVSPLIGGSAFSGPAEKLMRAFGVEVSGRGVASFYNEVLSYFVVDSSENVGGLQGNVNILKTDILMDNLEKRKALAEFILGVKI